MVCHWLAPGGRWFCHFAALGTGCRLPPGLARIFHSHFGKRREKPCEKRGANTFEGVVEKTRHAGLETCDTAGWEACATMVCHGFAGFTMKYPLVSLCKTLALSVTMTNV